MNWQPVDRTFIGTVTCSNCWQTFDRDDWRAPQFARAAECFYCRTVLVTPEQRHAGFLDAMRRMDTATLQCWATSASMSGTRKEAAALVLRERGLQ